MPAQQTVGDSPARRNSIALLLLAIAAVMVLAGCGGGKHSGAGTNSKAAKSQLAARTKNIRTVVLSVQACKQKVQNAPGLPQATKNELDEVCALGFKTGAMEIGRYTRQVCDEIALLTPTNQLVRARSVAACEGKKST